MTGRTIRQSLLTLAAACLLMGAGAARAEVRLRWSPGDTTSVALDGIGRIAIMLDDTLSFRTIEATVEYDTSMVRSLGGGPGALFSESGFFVFDGFEESPGAWHGFAIVMGAGDVLTGPGELLFWDFQGLKTGLTGVTSVDIKLYDTASPPALYPDVILPSAMISIGASVSGVGEIPASSGTLQLAPNPFNPRTNLRFEVPRDTWARLSVYDLHGRRVAVLHDSSTPAGSLTVEWDGADDHGRAQPGGVYLFQLQTEWGTTQTKGLLLK